MVSRFTGVERHSPLVRPLTRSSREPITLTPSKVSRRTARLKTLVVNHPGCRYRDSVIAPSLSERRALAPVGQTWSTMLPSARWISTVNCGPVAGLG